MPKSRMPDPKFAQADLTAAAQSLLQAAGCSPEDAALVAGALARADASGLPSHGLARLPDYLRRLREGGNDPAARPEVVSEHQATAVVDGNHALGQVAGAFGMSKAIELAGLYGIGAVTCRRSSHFGSAADYVRMAAEAGCIGIATTNASGTMAPFGGITPMLGNNPIAIGSPTGDEPFLLDMALSVAAKGKIRLLAAQGAPIPEGWATDARGRPTTDAQEAVAGLATWMGGHKGYGLAIAADVLSGVLSGGAFGSSVGPQPEYDRRQEVGHFFAAIRIESFLSPADFAARFDGLVGELRSSEPVDGSGSVLIPGDLESRARTASAERGVPLSAVVWSRLEDEARRLGVLLARPEPVSE
jgi:LDH2 family malate/lactate/ureidoglycolate dehydrogenase